MSENTTRSSYTYHSNILNNHSLGPFDKRGTFHVGFGFLGRWYGVPQPLNSLLHYYFPYTSLTTMNHYNIGAESAWRRPCAIRNDSLHHFPFPAIIRTHVTIASPPLTALHPHLSSAWGRHTASRPSPLLWHCQHLQLARTHRAASSVRSCRFMLPLAVMRQTQPRIFTTRCTQWGIACECNAA